MKYRFISYRVSRQGNKILKLETQPGWFAWWFGRLPKVVEFIGSSTVWHTYPQYRRCSTSLEMMLCQFDVWIKEEGIKPEP